MADKKSTEAPTIMVLSKAEPGFPELPTLPRFGYLEVGGYRQTKASKRS